MKKLTQIKQLSLTTFSALILTAAIGGAALAVPCLIPTADCPPADCG